MRKQFSKRADCVAAQYGDYTVIDDIKINSRLTLGEDVADLGGTLLAYIAWKNATKDQKLEPRDGSRPSSVSSWDSRNGIAGMNVPRASGLAPITDPHSPGEYRINGVVSNMPEFAAAFSCKAGQPMVRAKACRVW